MTKFKIAALSLAALAVTAAAVPASAHPHHRRQVCRVDHHHRVCHWVR